MTHKEKDLLITDLCARLKYGVKAQYYDMEAERYDVDFIDAIDLYGKDPEVGIGQYSVPIDKIKPYLRPMSSMTKLEEVLFKLHRKAIAGASDSDLADAISSMNLFLHSRHLDYRGLISSGLALEAKEGTYGF